MKNVITIDECTSFKSEKNLIAALRTRGLLDHPCRRIHCLTPAGKWTAIFLATEYINQHGGYVCFAAQYGFMSV